MKKIRKIMTLVIATVMVLAMAAPAMAAETPTYSITINKNTTDKAAHTYGAYQLFKGDLAEKDGKTILSNIQWGDNVTAATIITELKKISAFSSLADDASAPDVAKAISDQAYTTDSEGARALAEALNKGITGSAKGTAAIAADATTGTISGLVAGYYLVKDTTDVSGEGAATKYILEVVKNVTVTEKASVPSVDKQIAETTPTKVSDYNIGDTIPYTITGTLPSTFESYETYKTFTFTDTFSAGLTAPATNDVTVKIGNDDITNLFDIAISGEATAVQTMTVTLKSTVDLRTATHGTSNTKFANNDEIVVSYNAKLNDSAVVGGDGNINTAKITFSNNPNSDSDGKTGETPDDKTVVFTYTIKALKVEATNDAPIDQTAYDALSDEQKAEYMKVGSTYQKVQALAGAGFTLYKGSTAADKTDANKVKEITAGTTTTFEFKGVDVGTYILSETTVPSGYNQIDDTVIIVSATYTNDKPAKIATLTVSPDTIGFVADKASGEVSGKILNQKGSVLPSTGGIGTTIFYVLGAVLVLGAGVLLVTRRRMNND